MRRFSHKSQTPGIARRFLWPALAILLLGLFLASIGSSERDIRQKKENGKMNTQRDADGKIHKSDAEWRKLLSPEQYRVLRKKGTEPPFSGKYNDFKENGVFVCAACGAPLFSSDAKYNSGSGWPSFYDVIDAHAIERREDNSLFMKRTEVLCAVCGSHLGHLFADGPAPTGLRYCVNSVALKFVPASDDSAKK